jgi:hypothetical protein
MKDLPDEVDRSLQQAARAMRGTFSLREAGLRKLVLTETEYGGLWQRVSKHIFVRPTVIKLR